MSDIINRFLRYVRIDTRSVVPVSGVESTHPSSPGQLVLLALLKEELLEMGVKPDWIHQLEDGSVLITLPATEGNENAPHAVFAAHVDTHPDSPGGADPQTYVYMGGDIQLLKNGVIIPASDLVGFEGQLLITTDGSTLLGADDKAGVAAIMEMIEVIVANFRHGPVTIWFCVDEETGQVGVSYLPSGVAEQWDMFVTADGIELNTVDIGCFNGAKTEVKFTGNDAHPGIAGSSINPAHYAACRFVDKLGEVPTPWATKGEESFLYVPSLSAGTASMTTVPVLPRTFSLEEIPEMMATIERLAQEAADRYGVKVVVGEPEVLYVSTELAIKANPQLVQPCMESLKDFKIMPVLRRVRAGTDGAMLNMTFPHIPAPNMGTGARNIHGVREFLVVDELETLPGVLISMVDRYSNMIR